MKLGDTVINAIQTFYRYIAHVFLGKRNDLDYNLNKHNQSVWRWTYIFDVSYSSYFTAVDMTPVMVSLLLHMIFV